MSDTVVSKEDIEEIRSTLRNFRKPAKLSQSRWLSSCLVTERLPENGKYQAPKILQKIFTEILELLQKEEPEYAKLLKGRFWDGHSVKAMITFEHPGQWAERNFYNIQRKAIKHFALLILEQEEICRQRRQETDSSETTGDTADVSAPAGLSTSWLPSKSYRELVGRDTRIKEIIDALGDPAGRWIIGIDGLGGIGKTALALEVAHRCLAEQLFDVAVWSKAPDQNIADRPDHPGDRMTFETVLNAIGLQLGAADTSKLVGEEKEARVQALLRNQRVLVVLDNLETALEPQFEIVRRLQPLLSPSKALLTSRYRFRGPVYSLNLTGLGKLGAAAFIRQVAIEKNISQVNALADKDLNEIIQSTGGSPLAISLVVGQLSHLPLEMVLDQLKNIRLSDDRDTEDDYFQFYRFIFSTSAQLLSDNGERLLYWMTHFPAGIGGPLPAIKSSPTLDLTDDQLFWAIDELWKLSFLEITKEAKSEQQRYYLHALTKYFVLADMLKLLR